MSLSDSISEQSKMKDAVLASEFYEILEANPQNGITGYFISPSIGAGKRTIPGAEVQDVVVSESEEIKYAIRLRPDDEQWFSEDFEEQFENRLRLKIEGKQSVKDDTQQASQYLPPDRLREPNPLGSYQSAT